MNTSATCCCVGGSTCYPESPNWCIRCGHTTAAYELSLLPRRVQELEERLAALEATLNGSVHMTMPGTLPPTSTPCLPLACNPSEYSSSAEAQSIVPRLESGAADLYIPGLGSFADRCMCPWLNSFSLLPFNAGMCERCKSHNIPLRPPTPEFKYSFGPRTAANP